MVGVLHCLEEFHSLKYFNPFGGDNLPKGNIPTSTTMPMSLPTYNNVSAPRGLPSNARYNPISFHALGSSFVCRYNP